MADGACVTKPRSGQKIVAIERATALPMLLYRPVSTVGMLQEPAFGHLSAVRCSINGSDHFATVHKQCACYRTRTVHPATVQGNSVRLQCTLPCLLFLPCLGHCSIPAMPTARQRSRFPDGGQRCAIPRGKRASSCCCVVNSRTVGSTTIRMDTDTKETETGDAVLHVRVNWTGQQP